MRHICAYKCICYMNIYIYISAGPCLSGCHQAEEARCKSSIFVSRDQVNLYSYQGIRNIGNNGIGSLDLVCLLGPRIMFLPSTFCLASDLGLPGNILKYMRIPTSFQDPQKSEKVSPRPPTNSKMKPKTFPLDTQLLNKWKKWNHSTTTVFTMV